MIRPRSIVAFERAYLGALAVGAINSALHYANVQALKATQQATAMFGGWYLPTVTVLGFVVPLLLWFFVARGASVVAKWVIVVFAGLGVVGLAFGLLMGSYVTQIAALLSVVAIVFNVFAAWLLFRPDALAWFGETPPSSEERST